MNTLLTILVSAGGGTLITALVGAMASFSQNRASAVKLLSEAAKTLATEHAEENRELRLDIRQLRESLIHLTDAVDQVIPLLAGELTIGRRNQLERLVQLNTAAKLAV
jgi:hypothetical protein